MSRRCLLFLLKKKKNCPSTDRRIYFVLFAAAGRNWHGQLTVVIPTWYATSCSSRISVDIFFVTHNKMFLFLCLNWFCYFLNLNSYYSKLRHFKISPFVNCLFTTCKLVDIPINNSKKKKRQKKTGSHTVLDCGIDMGLVSAGGTCGMWHHLWYAHLFLFSVEEPYGDSKCPKVSLGIESVVAGQPDGIRTHQTPIVAFGRRRRWWWKKEKLMKKGGTSTDVYCSSTRCNYSTNNDC